MRSMSLVVKDNSKSPPVALLRPKVSLTEKEEETVDTVYKRRVWNETRPRKSEHKGKGSPDRKNRKEDQPRCYAFKKDECPKGNSTDCWHPLESSCHNKASYKLGKKCAFKQTEKAGDEPKKRKDSVAVDKTWDITASQEGTYFSKNSERRRTFCMFNQRFQ